MVRGVVFDLDGLLLDTEPLYTEGNQMICSRYDKIYSTEIRVQVIGKAELLGASVIVEQLSIPLTPKVFLEEREKILEDIFPKAKLLPGAEKLIRHLHTHNIPMAVATSSNSHAVELKLKNHQHLFSLFGENIVRGDNPGIKHGKPAPDIFLVAAKLIGLDPKDCLVFEDSVSGAQAGKSAGMTLVSVPEATMFQFAGEDYKIADLIIHSLEDFVPENFDLPPFKK